MDTTQISQLCHAEQFDHPVEHIQLIETHISWVILTGHFAYKIKKPVNFGFLDFSTLQKRELSCKEEIRLNSRICTGLYLAVIPVVCADGRIIMDGEGTVVDYAVKMRQFDPRATLAQLLADGQVAINEFEKMGYRIGAFHRLAAVATENSEWGSSAAIKSPVQENFNQIKMHVSVEVRNRIDTLASAAESAAQLFEKVFEKRKKSGHVRELHGDLHAGNVALIDQQWVPFDCIEFNPDLRWIDTASDIAFLVMDLECRGFEPEANRFLNAYLEYTGDYELLQVLHFYQCYRAMVRAKVAMLRLQQTPDSRDRSILQGEFDTYLTYCEQLQRPRQLFLVMMMGVSGSGKSTVARQMAARHGAIHVRADAVRKRLFGFDPDQVSDLAVRDELYSEAASKRTFLRMEALAALSLDLNYPVIMDATFIKKSTRAPFLSLAQQLNIPVVILSCEANETELERRILQRIQQGNDVSEADAGVMRNQLRHVEPLDDKERQIAIEVGREGWESRLSDLIS